MRPTFAITTGAIGKPSIRHTLDSIARQGLIPGDRVMVCIDIFERHTPTDGLQTLVTSYGPQYEYYEYNSGHHFYGVEQSNFLIRKLQQDRFESLQCLACLQEGQCGLHRSVPTHFLSLGDDDVYVDGAFNEMRDVLEQDLLQPYVFRFDPPWRGLLWNYPPRMEVCFISGQCLPIPMAHLAEVSLEQACTVDFPWMMDAIARSGKNPIFVDYVNVIARPDEYRGAVLHAIWRCWAHGGNYGYVDSDGLPIEPCCPSIELHPKARIVRTEGM